MGLLSWLDSIAKKQKQDKLSGGKQTTASSHVSTKQNVVAKNYNPVSTTTPKLKPVTGAPYSNKEIESRKTYNQTAIQKPSAATTRTPIGTAFNIKPVAPAVTQPVRQEPTKPKTLLNGNTPVTRPVIIQDAELAPVSPFLMQNIVGTPEAVKTIDKVKSFHAAAEKKKLVDQSNVFSPEYRAQVNKDYEKAQKDSQYSAQAALEKENTLDDLKLTANEQKDVTTITTAELDAIQRAQENGRLQVVYLRKDKNYIATTKTGWGAQEISAHYLNGIKDEDEIVLFDSVTKRFYRYDSNTKESQTVYDQMNTIAEEQQTLYNDLNSNAYQSLKKAQSYASTLNAVAGRIEAGTATQQDYDIFNNTYKQYNELTNTKEYTALANKYNDTFSKLETLQTEYDATNIAFKAYGLSDIVMNEDWKNAMHANVDKVNTARKEFEAMRKYYSDPRDSAQMNSVSDAIRKFVGATSFDEQKRFRPLVDLELQDIKNLGKDLVEQFKQTWGKPISFLMNHWDVDADLVQADYNKRIAQLQKENAKMSIEEIEKKFGTRANLDARMSQQFNVIKQAGGMLLTNTLTNLGETFDMFNVLKPGMVGDKIYGNEELINEAGLQQYYQMALEEPEELLKKQLAPIDNTLSEEERQEKARANAMADIMTKAYWGAYDSATPQFEYEMLWLDADENFSTFAAQMALDVFLDPSLYFGLAPLKFAKAGTMIDDVADNMSQLVKQTDFGEELTEREIKRAAKRAVNDAIMQNMPIEDTFNKQLAKQLVDAAQTGGKMKQLMKNLPDTGWTSVLKNRADDVHLFMTRFSELSDSGVTAYRTVRNENIQSAIRTIGTAGRQDMAVSLGDSYNMIRRMTKIKKAMDFIDSVAFNTILPVTPVRKIAQAVKSVLRNDESIIGATQYLSTMLGRLNGKLKDAPLSVTELDTAMKVVEREVYSLTSANLLDTKVGDGLLGAAHRAIINDVIDNELSDITTILTSGELKSRGQLLANKFASISEDITDLQDYYALLQRPIGSTHRKLYEVLDNSTISKLRATQRFYKEYQLDSMVSNVNTITDAVDTWSKRAELYVHGVVNDRISRDFTPQGLHDGFNAIIDMLDDSRRLYIEGISTITKDELFNAIHKAQQSVTTSFDAALNGVTTNSAELLMRAYTKSIGDVQELFQRYAQDVRDAAASHTVYRVNKKVEREFITTRTVLDNTQRVELKTLVNNFKKAFKEGYGVEPTEQELGRVFFNRLKDMPNDMNLTEELRVYVGMLTKSSRAIEYVSDPDLIRTVEPFLSSNSAYRTYVNYLQDTDEAATAVFKNIIEEASAFTTTHNLFKNVSLSDASNTYVGGILDALAGEQNIVNAIFKDVNPLDMTSVRRASDSITDHIIQSASEYLAQTSPTDVRLFDVTFNQVKHRLNSIDTEKNVYQMQYILNDIKSAREYLSKDADKYYDVFYSVSKVNDYGDPYMITLHYGDKTVTLKNSDIIYNPLPDYSRRAHGISSDAAKVEFDNIHVNQGLPKLEFERAIADAMYDIKKLATNSEEGAKSIRFVGYNNGIMGTNQDRTLNNYIRKHAIAIHNDMTIDLADFIRIERGIPVYDTETRHMLHTLVEHNVDLAIQNGATQLLTTFDNTVFATAKELSAKVKASLKDVNNLRYPTEFLDTVSNMLSNLSDAARKVSNTVADMATPFEGIVIREKALLDIIRKYRPESPTTGIDIPGLLREAMHLDNQDFIFNVQKMVDAKLYDYLYDARALSKYINQVNPWGTVNVGTLYQVKSVSDQLYSIIKRIRQPEAIRNVGAETYQRVFKTILNYTDIGEVARNADFDVILNTVKMSDPEIMYATALWAFQNTTYHMAYKDKTQLIKEIFETMEIGSAQHNAFNTIVNADGLIFNTRTASFTLNDRAYYSNMYGTLGDVSQRLDDMTSMHSYINNLTSLTQINTIQETLEDASNLISASEKISNNRFKQVSEPYIDFLQRLVGISDTQPSHMDYSTLIETYTRSKKVNDVKLGMRDMAAAQRNAAMHTVFGLSDEDFFVYLVRDSKNTVVVDVTSSMMQNKAVREQVLGRIEELNKNPLFTVQYDETGSIIKIFHDIKNLDGADMDNFYRQLKEHTVDYWTNYQNRIGVEVSNIIARNKDSKVTKVAYDYSRMIEAMRNDLPDHWVISTFNVNTQDTAKNLLDTFPNAARLNMDDMNAYGLFDDSFTCSVWMDPDKIIAENLIQYYTPDLIKSIGTGLYQVRNNLEAIKNKFAMYGNETQSLQYFLNNSGMQFTGYKEFNRQLEYNGLTLSKGIEHADGTYKVKRLKVLSDADFARYAADNNVLLLPNDVLLEMIQYSKGHNKSVRYNQLDASSVHTHEMFNWWNQKIRSARITMYLFGNPATGIRNYADSATKGWLTTMDPDFFRYYLNSSELLNRYEEVYARAIGYYSKGDYADIVQLFKEHPDEVAGLDLDMMLRIYAHRTSASSGGMLSSLMNLKITGNFLKLKEAVKDVPSITDEMVRKAMRIYQEQYAATAHKVTKDIIAYKASVEQALKSEGITGDALTALTEQFYGYTPSSATFTDWSRSIPGLLYYLGKAPKPDITDVDKITKGKSLFSNYITMNANLFGGAEDRVRLAMYMYYTDRGYTSSAANKKIISSQFDYSARPEWLDKLEVLAPFSTFKMYNAAYWMSEAPKHFNVIRQATKLTTNTGVGFDTEEIMNLTRGVIIRNKLASGDIQMTDTGDIDREDSPDGIWSALAQTIMGEEGVIATYEGQPGMYAELAGGIPLGRHHVLKLGNTFVEGLSFINTMLFAIPQMMHGEVPDLLKDNVYSPLRTTLGLFRVMIESGFDGDVINKWIQDNYYDVVDFLPFVGALTNLAITHMKNGQVNLKDMIAVAINPELLREFMATTYEQFFNVSGTFLPGLVGTTYDKSFYDRPIGFDWYNQTKDYKSTHRYVFGISYMPTFYGKDPRSYVDYSAMFMRMGYTAEEARAIISALAGGDINAAPENWWYNPDTFDMFLQHLLDRGYTMTEALHVLMNEDLWNGDDLWKLHQEQQLNNSVFYTMYDRLPDYIKYTDEQFSALRSYYRTQGLNEAQTWTKLLYGNGYVDVFGNYKELSPETVASIQSHLASSYAEFYAGLPEWFRYEDGAATRAVNYLQNVMGFTTQQARNYIIDFNFYVDIKNIAHYMSAEESAQLAIKNKEDFNNYYSNIPEFMRYEKGAYGRTLGFLVNIQGIDEDEAKRMIMNGAYLTLDGILIDCRGLKRVRQYNQYAANRYRSWKQWYSYGNRRRRTPRPKRVRKRYIKRNYGNRPYNQKWNSAKTYSLVNVRHGTNHGARNAYKVSLGYNSATSALSTTGSYPRAWRNVAQSYRRNMYKENYAKYGASRILMRAGVIKGYSNASVTRLRRGEVYANRMYKNRRTF